MTRQRILLVASSGFLVLFANVVIADIDAIERCRKSIDTATQIACLEAALAGEQNLPEPEPSVENVDKTAVEAEPPESLPHVATPRTDEALGAEQIRSRDGATAKLANVRGLEVDRYNQVPYKRLEVYLKNGQIWRQIKGDTQEVKATLRKNQTVDIEESAIGGYKLRLNEIRRTIRVRRVK